MLLSFFYYVLFVETFGSWAPKDKSGDNHTVNIEFVNVYDTDGLTSIKKSYEFPYERERFRIRKAHILKKTYGKPGKRMEYVFYDENGIINDDERANKHKNIKAINKQKPHRIFLERYQAEPELIECNFDDTIGKYIEMDENIRYHGRILGRGEPTFRFANEHLMVIKDSQETEGISATEAMQSDVYVPSDEQVKDEQPQEREGLSAAEASSSDDPESNKREEVSAAVAVKL